MHRWANFLDSVPFVAGSHWGFSSVGGQLGGWKHSTFQQLGATNYQANNGRTGIIWFGTVANGGNALSYSDFELYLMGLIPTNGLPPVYIAQNPAWIDDAAGQFSASSISTVSLAQVVATDGSRIPDYSASQTNFRAIHVVLTTGTVSKARMAEYDQEAYDFGLAGNDGQSAYNFWEATGGRATMKMDSLLEALRTPDILNMNMSNGTVSVSFKSKQMVRYAVQRSTTLTNWTTVTGTVDGVTGTLSIKDPASTNLMKAFYRVVVE
jgi:hypothetical protein